MNDQNQPSRSSDRVDLRSYAGQQGVPFRAPPETQPPAKPQPFDPFSRPVLVMLAIAAAAILLGRAWGAL